MPNTDTAALRARLEATIEHAIDALNKLDGDPDLEAEEDCCAAEEIHPGPFLPGLSDHEDCEAPAFEVLDQRFWSRARKRRARGGVR